MISPGKAVQPAHDPMNQQLIISTIDRVHAQALSEAASRLSGLTFSGTARRFLVCRMGSTGSTWLAKLLNSHPEVRCSHEGYLVVAYPMAPAECGHEEVLKFIEYFAWEGGHDAYQVLGDVGSVWLGHLPHLRSATTGLLLRHPARVLRTRQFAYSGEQPPPPIPAQSRECIREIWDIDTDIHDPFDQLFLHDAFTYASHVWGLGSVDVLIRLEEMRNPERCHAMLAALTGLTYSPELVELAVNRPVHQRTAGGLSIREIVAGFSARQRDWYRLMLGEVAPGLGYSLFDDIDPGR
jgi:hypothetical protein